MAIIAWFYARDGVLVGPFTDAEFAPLLDHYAATGRFPDDVFPLSWWMAM